MGIANLKIGIRGAFFALVAALCLAVMAGGGSSVRAAEPIEDANTALLQGKYKDVLRIAGQVIANGKQKPEMMSRALLLRGIAYRNQGKFAQAIADFSNAEWVQKLRGVELRRLYAERALAYEAVGQKDLAAKDRRMAGAASIQTAQRSSEEGGNVSSAGVRVTSVGEKQSTTSELFGGLGNLFGFNSGNKKTGEIKTKVIAKSSTPVVREIPTLDSKEAEANRAKLNGEVVAETKVKTEAKPSNSAWVGRKPGEKDIAKAPAGQPAVKETLPWANDGAGAVKTPGPPPVATAAKPPEQKVALQNVTPVGGAIPQNGGPIELTPSKVKPGDGPSPMAKFFKNIFGGGEEPVEQAPVTPGDDIISADQVASIEKPTVVQPKKPIKRSEAQRKAAAQKRKVAAKPKLAAKKPAKKPVPQRAESRSLYHVQLGVFGEAQAADKFVSRLNKNFGPVVGSKTAMVVETDLGQQRRQYRVYLGPFRSREKGIKSCKTLTRLGMGCSLVE